MDHIKQKIGVGKITLICEKCGAQQDIDTNLPRKVIDKELDSFNEAHEHPGRDK